MMGQSRSKKKKNKTTKPSPNKSGGLDSAVSGVSSEKSALLSFAEAADQGSFAETSRKGYEEVHPSAWTVDQVCDWLASHGIPEKIRDKFSEQVIDGFMLLNTEEDDVVHDLGITRRNDVNKLLAAIQLLKSKAKQPVEEDEDDEEDSSDFEHSEEEDDDDEEVTRGGSRWAK